MDRTQTLQEQTATQTKNYPSKQNNLHLISNLVNRRFSSWKNGLGVTVREPELAVDLPIIIAVGGGKGGVGKSVLSANMSARLAMAGYRSLAIDLDLGCSNLHTHFAQQLPQKNLAETYTHSDRGLGDALNSTDINGLFFAPAGREELWVRSLNTDTTILERVSTDILNARKDFGVDFVVLDLGAGTHPHTMDFFLMAHVGLVVVLPEPTSIENAYVFMRSILWQLAKKIARRNPHVIAERDLEVVFSVFTQVGPSGQYKSYQEALLSLRPTFTEFIDILVAGMQARSLGIVINQARSQNDIDIGFAMEHICKSYFGLDSFNLGSLNYDESVWRSLRNRKLLVKDFPHSIVAKKLDQGIQKVFDKLGLRREQRNESK